MPRVYRRPARPSALTFARHFFLPFALLLIPQSQGCSGARVHEGRLSTGEARREIVLRGLSYQPVYFFDRVRDGDAVAAELFLSAGMSPELRDENGNTPLVLAARNDHTQVVRTLLRWEADPNGRGERGHTALMHSVLDGSAETSRALLEGGADPNAQAEDGTTALMYAVARNREEMVVELIRSGADVNVKDRDIGTALTWAVYYDNPDITRILLDAGADPNAQNQGGGTPLMTAAVKGNAGIVRLLLERGADPRARDGKEKKNSLDYALGAGRLEAARLLRDAMSRAAEKRPEAGAPAQTQKR